MPTSEEIRMRVYSPINNLIIKVEKEYNDRIGSFYLTPDYRPEWNVTQFGTVVTVPDFIDKKALFMDGIEFNVKEGDKIYFDYSVVDRETSIEKNNFRWYYVPYYLVYCVVREGNISAIGNWNIVETLKYKRDDKEGHLYVPDRLKIIDYKCKGILRYGMNNLKNKIVYFPEFANNRVIIENNEYVVIDKQYIYAYE